MCNYSRLKGELRYSWDRGLVAGLCWGEPCSEPRISLFDGELFRIEALTDPLDTLRIVGMRGIRQHGEKVLITPGTAAVLGRAVPFSGKTGGVATCLERPSGSLNQDRAFPVVAKVIGVGKAADAGVQHLVQGQPLLVGHIVEAVRVAILAAGDVEGMEMAAVPANRRLDRLMQVAQRHLTRHEKASPDRGLGTGERHLEAEGGLAGVARLRGGLGHDPHLPQGRRRSRPFARGL